VGVYGVTATVTKKKLSVSLCVFRAPLHPLMDSLETKKADETQLGATMNEWAMIEDKQENPLLSFW
jgi:hypothetical protein